MRTDNSTPRVNEQPERFDEFTGGYDMTDHNRAAKRISADLRKMPTPRVGHTPGPWQEWNTHQGRIMQRWRVGSQGATAGITVPVAEIDNQRGTTEEQYANARLIAAAPCMLAALRDAEAELTYASAVVNIDKARLDAIRAAIARATNGGVQ
jgi:hypothetical protein